MRKYAVALVCLFLGCAAGSVMPTITAQSFGPNPSAQRWEQFCDFETRGDEGLTAQSLQRHGAQGWELVGFQRDSFPCFKRPAAQ